jgi:hypothetical protein
VKKKPNIKPTMKSEKGIHLLLLLCGRALVDAELRGTAAAKSFLNTRTLQTTETGPFCKDYKACIYVFGGPDNVPPNGRCCPDIDNIYKNCCGAAAPTAPAPPTPAPTLPDDNRVETPPPTGGGGTIPLPPTTTPNPDALCMNYPACVAESGGADKVLPGSLCCPTPYGQRMNCCDDNRVETPLPTGGEPPIPLPPITVPPPTIAPPIPVPPTTTPNLDASCLNYPACVALFGGADKVLPGSLCCPTPYGQRMNCCGP